MHCMAAQQSTAEQSDIGGIGERQETQRPRKTEKFIIVRKRNLAKVSQSDLCVHEFPAVGREGHQSAFTASKGGLKCNMFPIMAGLIECVNA
jgi:hypothetical protein